MKTGLIPGIHENFRCVNKGEEVADQSRQQSVSTSYDTGCVRKRALFGDFLQKLPNTLADIYLRTGNFKKNVLRYYSRTTKGNETNDTPFESPIK